LSDITTTRLELRLNQCDDAASRFQPQNHHREQQRETDERGIHNRQINQLVKMVDEPGVGAFHHDDTRITAQTRVKMAVADINCVNPRGAVLQQAVCESARAGAHVRAYEVLRHKLKRGESGVQFVPATRHKPGFRFGRDRAVNRDAHSGFVTHYTIHRDFACHDHATGFLAAWR
jgi:hypothetical protein